MRRQSPGRAVCAPVQFLFSLVALILFGLSGPQNVTGQQAAGPPQENNLTPGSGIEWLANLEEARKTAKRDRMNVLVLANAPAWCDPCRAFEAQVLRDARIVQWVSRNFVPVYLPDSDPDHTRVSPEAYPTMIVMNPGGVEIARLSGLASPKELIEWLERHSLYVDIDADDIVRIEGGSLHRVGPGTWELRRAGEPLLLEKYDEDGRFLYLRSAAGSGPDGSSSRGEGYYAVTTDATSAFRWDGDKERWVQLPPVPGDES